MKYFGLKNWDELSHEERGHIFPTYYYWRSVQLAAKVVDTPPGIYGMWYKDDGFSWMTTKGALANTGKKILEKLEENDELINKIDETNNLLIPVMLKESEWFNQDLTNKTGEELIEHFELVNDAIEKLMTYSVLATVMEFEEPVLSDKLFKILSDKVGETKAGEYFSELTEVEKITIAQIEQLALKNLEEKDIEKHWKKYCWIPYNYDGPAWTLDEVKERFKKKDEIKEVDFSARIKKRKEIEEKLELSEQEKYLFQVIRTLGYWKFERKLWNTKSHWLVEKMYIEIARRFNITLEDAKSILPNELKNVLVDEKIDVSELKSRRKLAIGIFDGYEHFELISGEDAKKIDEDIMKCLEVDTTIREIKGTTAYKGYAKGKIKIVNTVEEMKDFEEGNILLSRSTSPEIISAMKKAAAIVTDSGGITCHAAIVARELKVPTIIGTKFATKIFKNNEEVEVDANNATVKKI